MAFFCRLAVRPPVFVYEANGRGRRRLGVSVWGKQATEGSAFLVWKMLRVTWKWLWKVVRRFPRGTWCHQRRCRTSKRRRRSHGGVLTEILRHLEKQSAKISTVWFHTYAACYLSAYLSVFHSHLHNTSPWMVFLSAVVTFFFLNKWLPNLEDEQHQQFSNLVTKQKKKVAKKLK